MAKPFQHPYLAKLRDMRENFESLYHRKMTPQEERLFARTEETLRNILAKETEEKDEETPD